MKKLLLAIAFIGFIAVSSYAATTLLNTNSEIELTEDNKKGDKKDCKKKKCKKGDKKSCSEKKGESTKSCCSKDKKKSCSKDKKK